MRPQPALHRPSEQRLEHAAKYFQGFGMGFTRASICQSFLHEFLPDFLVILDLKYTVTYEPTGFSQTDFYPRGDMSKCEPGWWLLNFNLTRTGCHTRPVPV